MKSTLKIFALLLSIIIMNQTSASTDINDPVYYLEFSIHGTGADIRLNDIPVYYHDDPGTTESQKPVPESIVNGTNTLTIKTFPLDENNNQENKNSYVEAIISINGRNAPLNASKPVLKLIIHPSSNEDNILTGNNNDFGDSSAKIINHSDDTIIAERSIHIDSPYPRWAWQDGETITDSQENYDSLLDKYKEIYQALKQDNKEEIHKIYAAAAQEYANSYNYQDIKDGFRIMSAGELAEDNDWVLGDINLILSKRKYHLDIYAHGKLARILDYKNNPSLITYLNKNVKMVSYQKFGFYKTSDGKWIMIR